MVPPAPDVTSVDVTQGQAVSPAAESESWAEADGGEIARITLRLPEQVKTRIEHAAAAERRSVNAWLVRAIGDALQTRKPSPGSRPSTRPAGNGSPVGIAEPSGPLPSTPTHLPHSTFGAPTPEDTEDTSCAPSQHRTPSPSPSTSPSATCGSLRATGLTPSSRSSRPTRPRPPTSPRRTTHGSSTRTAVCRSTRPRAGGGCLPSRTADPCRSRSTSRPGRASRPPRRSATCRSTVSWTGAGSRIVPKLDYGPPLIFDGVRQPKIADPPTGAD